MRMIDADKARTKLVYFTSPTGIDEAPYEFASDIIDKMPTVDAIPIEWIRQYIHSIGGSNGVTKLHKEILKTMVNDWEKENEAD